MMNRLFSPPLGPNTPEWLVTTATIVCLLVFASALAWGFILERRYTGPYTLLAAPNKKKWQWAATVMLLQTIWVPLGGLLQPLMSPHSGQWPGFPLAIGRIWIVAYPIALLYKRWDLERQLNGYRKMNEAIHKGIVQRIYSRPFVSWTKWLMNSEMKRFLEEGYPNSIPGESDLNSIQNKGAG